MTGFLACPKCGDLNALVRTHCESCGARLGLGPYTRAYPTKPKEKVHG